MSIKKPHHESTHLLQPVQSVSYGMDVQYIADYTLDRTVFRDYDVAGLKFEN
jgi:hypothetical protein